jgi:hypothetical protein
MRPPADSRRGSTLYDLRGDENMDGTGPETSLTSTQQTLPCRHCGRVLQHTVVDLGMSPLCESFLPERALAMPESYYPLHVRVCDACWLAQLPEFVSPAHIFTEYAYFSSYSVSWVAHAKAYCEMIRSRLGLRPNSLVVELGSNDGYLLQHFLALGQRVLGIEPAANVATSPRQRLPRACPRGLPSSAPRWRKRLRQSKATPI